MKKYRVVIVSLGILVIALTGFFVTPFAIAGDPSSKVEESKEKGSITQGVLPAALVYQVLQDADRTANDLGLKPGAGVALLEEVKTLFRNVQQIQDTSKENESVSALSESFREYMDRINDDRMAEANLEYYTDARYTLILDSYLKLKKAPSSNFAEILMNEYLSVCEADQDTLPPEFTKQLLDVFTQSAKSIVAQIEKLHKFEESMTKKVSQVRTWGQTDLVETQKQMLSKFIYCWDSKKPNGPDGKDSIATLSGRGYEWNATGPINKDFVDFEMKGPKLGLGIGYGRVMKEGLRKALSQGSLESPGEGSEPLYVANDLSAGQISVFVREVAHELGPNGLKLLAVHAGSFLELNFSPESFSAIQASQLIHFFSKHELLEFYERAASWLKMGGILLISAQAPWAKAYIPEVTSKVFLEQINAALQISETIGPENIGQLFCTFRPAIPKLLNLQLRIEQSIKSGPVSQDYSNYLRAPDHPQALEVVTVILKALNFSIDTATYFDGKDVDGALVMVERSKQGGSMFVKATKGKKSKKRPLPDRTESLPVQN